MLLVFQSRPANRQCCLQPLLSTVYTLQISLNVQCSFCSRFKNSTRSKDFYHWLFINVCWLNLGWLNYGNIIYGFACMPPFQDRWMMLSVGWKTVNMVWIGDNEIKHYTSQEYIYCHAIKGSKVHRTLQSFWKNDTFFLVRNPRFPEIAFWWRFQKRSIKCNLVRLEWNLRSCQTFSIAIIVRNSKT